MTVAQLHTAVRNDLVLSKIGHFVTYRWPATLGGPAFWPFISRQSELYGSRQVHFFGSPTASDFNLRQHRTSDSIGLQPPTASDLNLRQHRTSDSVGLHLRQRRSSISDSVGLLSPTAADFYLRQRRTSSPTASDRTTISDSVGLQSPTAS